MTNLSGTSNHVLDVDSAPAYLLAKGLISQDSIVHGDLVVTSMPRRNRNLLVKREDGPGYLVKQPEPGGDGIISLGHEVAFYTFCQNEKSARPLRELLPRLAHVDPERPLLALELLENARPLWAYVRSFPPERFPTEVMRDLGAATATAHATLTTPGLADHTGLAWLRRETPWVLEAHRPSPNLLSVISRANYEILRILQGQPSLSRQLDEMRQQWEPLCVMHGDVKSDNVLVRSVDDDARVHLVDWELVQVGDPAWDVAGALQDCLISWIMSMSPAPTIEAMTATATYPLPMIQEAIRALLAGYSEHPSLPEPLLNAVRERATRFSAARLVQSAYEFSQAAETLPPTSVLLLQVAANILADPTGANEELFGLPSEGTAA